MVESLNLNKFERFLLLILFMISTIFVLSLSLFLPVIYTIVFVNVLFASVIVLYILLYLERRDFGKARKPKYFPSVSIVIPAYNSINTIEKCIDSVKKINYPKNKLEIIVVDDGSTDGTTQFLEKVGGIKLIKLSKNSGKAVALNTGLSKVRSEFVACIDSDTYPEPDVFLKTLGYFDDDNVAAVTCLVLPDKKDNFVQKIQYFEYATSFGLWSSLMSIINSIFVVPGPMTIFRRSVFERIGYYQEGNLTEDMELGLRIKKHGLKIMTCYEARVYTDIPDSFVKLFKQRNRWYRGSVFNFTKYRELFFNKKASDFGLIIMPYTFAVQILSIAIVFRISFIFLRELFNFIATSINVISLGGSLVFDFSNIVIPPIFLFFITTYLICIFYTALSFKLIGVKPSFGDLPALATLLFLYPYFITIVYTQSFFKELFGVRSKWVRASM